MSRQVQLKSCDLI